MTEGCNMQMRYKTIFLLNQSFLFPSYENVQNEELLTCLQFF